jgi:sucrose-6-phosphate hydrolase SacC (GH32 family)
VVTFKGEWTPMTEQVYFVVSSDGRTWEALNGDDPVLVSTLGEKGARDPFIMRSHDGKTFYVLATDLSIHHNGDWGRSVRAGSKSIVIWESKDLTHWSQPRLVKVAPDDAGCTWAPEAIYDEQTQDYLVFWASRSNRDGATRQRIWASRTRDFVSFGEPFIYIDKPNDVIDTTIVRDGGHYYRFSKDETRKAITMEASEKLMGPWRDVPTFSLARLEGYEGPTCFPLWPAAAGQPAQWCLMYDFYTRGTGYRPFLTSNLAAGKFMPAKPAFTFPYTLRHGTVLPITSEELARVKAALGGKNR